MSTRAHLGRTSKRLGKRRRSPQQRELVDVRVANRFRGEQGATMVMAAILIPVLAVFAGLAWGTAMVYGANQEGRGAADMAALSSAASLPLFNLSVNCKVTGSDTLSTPSTTLPTVPS